MFRKKNYNKKLIYQFDKFFLSNTKKCFTTQSNNYHYFDNRIKLWNKYKLKYEDNLKSNLKNKLLKVTLPQFGNEIIDVDPINLNPFCELSYIEGGV